MKKCIIIPDSFKGTMSAIEFCRLGADVVRRHMPDCQVVTVPVADGGEGTVDCFAEALGAKRIFVPATGPWGEEITACYARHGDTAFVEMAQCAGLPMVEGRKDPARTTTYGVGQVIRAAVEQGCRRVILGLGGSCTNDAGAGLACALGVRFYDVNGKPFTPTGATLGEIASYDTSDAAALLKNCTVTAMCDIDNPMYGSEGAACVFAPQKGADAAMVAVLDQQLQRLGGLLEQQTGQDIAHLPGAGAAGAMGAGVVAFLGGTLRSGIETVLDAVRFDELLQGADMVFTGEGRIDSQSIRGKVVVGVAERAAKQGVPVTVIVGAVGDGAEAAYERGVTAIFSINRKAEDFEKSRRYTHENFTATMDAIVRLLAR